MLQGAAGGDLEAFEAFVCRHQAAVYRFCLALSSMPEEVDDVLQETFLAAWRKASGFEGRGSARSWLFTIARRSYFREHRRARPVALGDETLEELGARAGWGDAESDVRKIENRALARELFARLSATDRQVLLLRDVEGLSTREAAEALGVAPRALKSRLHRARLRLIAKFQGDKHDGE